MSGRAARRVVVAVALWLASCGPPPPQAPPLFAKRLDSATGGISTACGEASQLTAFPGAKPSELLTLEITARSGALMLASVYQRNPSWIYQGETIRQIVRDSASMLESCGLHRAQAALERATRRH